MFFITWKIKTHVSTRQLHILSVTRLSLERLRQRSLRACDLQANRSLRKTVKTDRRNVFATSLAPKKYISSSLMNLRLKLLDKYYLVEKIQESYKLLISKIYNGKNIEAMSNGF